MNIAITTTHQTQIIAAQSLAHRLNLPFVMDAIANYDYLLVLTPELLGIQAPAKKTKLFYVDFTRNNLAYRLKKRTRNNELLVKAVGKDATHIIDATAGFGLDSFLLAAFGYQIIMLEQSPIIHALLFDALKRAEKIEELYPITSRLKLVHSDAITYLQKLPSEHYPDVIYLDPMFPATPKTAQVKKEMQLLQHLAHNPNEERSLFEMAATCAKHRVVVKRPRKGPAISSLQPSFTLPGSSSRFDVYLSHNCC